MVTIRHADGTSRSEILALARKSQAATNIPNPEFFPPHQFDDWLYSPRVIERFVADRDGRIVGHGVIEQPNPGDLPLWRAALPQGSKILELGGAFVDPDLMGQGIWSKLLDHRLERVRQSGGVPVSATWEQNEHVKRTFKSRGGLRIVTKATEAGPVCLFVFPPPN